MRSVLVDGSNIKEEDLIAILECFDSALEDNTFKGEAAAKTMLRQMQRAFLQKRGSNSVRNLSVGNVRVGPDFIEFISRVFLRGLFSLDLFNLKCHHGQPEDCLLDQMLNCLDNPVDDGTSGEL